MFRLTALGLLGGVVAQMTSESGNLPPYIAFAIALATGGVGAALVSGWSRWRSGEDRAGASLSVGQGAEAVSRGARQLIEPLEAQITELRRENVRLEKSLVDTRRELADRATAAADREAEFLRSQQDMESRHREDRIEIHTMRGKLGDALVALDVEKLRAQQQHSLMQAEINTLRVKVGIDPGRREHDPDLPS